MTKLNLKSALASTSPLLVLALLFMPSLALADVLIGGPGHSGSGLNAWDIFVFGNGKVITDILRTVSLFMTGASGYKTVMLTIAMTGFVVAAVKAGFLGASHFTKMVGYILMVGFLVFSTFNAKMHVIVNDPISGSYTAVQNVPLIVAGPPVFVTQVGFYFTESIESFFDIPDVFKTASGARGEGASRFNLFAKVAGDMDRFVLTDPAIKRTISAYYADCTIPAIARGRLSTNELNASPNLVQTLNKAGFQSVFTKYFAPTDLSQDNQTNPGLGEVTTCAQSYTRFVADLNKHSEELVSAQSEQWRSTGVSVTNEAALTALMEQLGATGGANNQAGYSSASGLARQKAMLSYNSAAYRDAAASLGNNELLTSLSIAQAEQAQRTNWFVAAEMFNNLMGYVYITLQAFMFAIIPLIFIGFVIPGLGGKLVVNYTQILIWLALWMPSLAIVNYLVTMFGIGELSQTWSAANGITVENSRTISEYTSNLTMAGAFLGTLVPMITWGLVKGGMAFSEFISAGLASGMAGTAAAGIASGNMSMNNISTDNTSMNKMNTAMSSTVGTQSVMGYMNSGNGSAAIQKGGVETSANGGAIGVGLGRAGGTESGTSIGGGASSTIGGSNNYGANRALSGGTSAESGRSDGRTESLVFGANSNTNVGDSRAQSNGLTRGDSTGVGSAATDIEAKTQGFNSNFGGSPEKGSSPNNGPSTPGPGPQGPGTGSVPQMNSPTQNSSNKKKLPIDLSAGLGAQAAITDTTSNTLKTERDTGFDRKDGVDGRKDISNSAGSSIAGNTSFSGGNSNSLKAAASDTTGSNIGRDARDSRDLTNTAGWQDSAKTSQGFDQRMNQGMSSWEVNSMMQSLENSISPHHIESRMTDMYGAYSTAGAESMSAFDANREGALATQGALSGQLSNLKANVGASHNTALTGIDGLNSAFGAGLEATNAQIDNTQRRLANQETELISSVDKHSDALNGNNIFQKRNGEFDSGAESAMAGFKAPGNNDFSAAGTVAGAGGVLGTILDIIPAGRAAKIAKKVGG